MAFIDYLRMLRPQQWYKNILIFTALIFTSNILNPGLLGATLIGFVSLCLVSSANYVINDIIDRKSDQANPEKRNRPIASGKVPLWEAWVIAAVLLAGSLSIASTLTASFMAAMSFLFAFSLLYSLVFKHEPFLDITSIAINFVVRAVSGAFIISVVISPWLVLCSFFLAMFLSVGKRRAELVFLKEDAKHHRKVLDHYNARVADSLLAMVSSALLVSYSLYCFLGQNSEFIITLPIVMYSLFRYIKLIYDGSEIARHPDMIVSDSRMVISVLAWIAITLILFH